MAESSLRALHDMLRPKVVWLGGSIIAAVAAWDSFSNQFPSWHMRKLGDLLPDWLGMTGALLPWWGWLLILQAVFTYALFEYVRTKMPSATTPNKEAVNADIEALKDSLNALQGRLDASKNQTPKLAKPAFNWAPWKMRQKYTLDEFSKIIAGINPIGGASNDSYAYLDVLTEQVASGALHGAGGYRLTRAYPTSEISRADALKWAKAKSLSVSHIED